MKSFEQKISFLELLLQDTRVSSNLTREELENLLDPERHTGFSAYFARKVHAEITQARRADL